jgi:hypothetical protein
VNVNDNSNSDGSVDVDVEDLGSSDTGTLTMSVAEFNKKMAAARKSGRGDRQQQQPEASRLDRIEQALEKLITTPAQPEAATRPPTAAPPSNAGNKVDRLTRGGLIDLWNLTPAELDQLGPSGIRREYEKHISEHAKSSPRVPMPPKKGD